MDIENTKSHIIRYEDWRVNADVDGIVADFSYPELGQVMETIDRFYYKTDLEGRPVYYERLANFNFEKLLKATTLDRFTKFWIREQEKLVDFRLPACSRAANHHVGQVFSILDLKGVGAGTFGDVKKLITHMAAIASQNYPETLYKLLIINTPWQFSAIWPLASAFMDPRTAAKVTILGKNYQKDVLLFISRENVPIDYGGSSEEEIHSDIGPWSSSLPENARWNFSARDL